MPKPVDNLWHRIFEAGVFLKLFHATIELIGSVLIMLSSDSIYRVLTLLTSYELHEDPNDFLANLIVQKTVHVSHMARDFAALYLFAAAAMNLILVTGLLFHKKVMFPISMVFLGSFAAFQLYFFARTFSPWLLVLASYDLVFIYLVYREYRLRWGSLPSDEE